MTRFVALYSGSDLAGAKLIAITGNREAVRAVAEQALQEMKDSPGDPASRAMEQGRRKALQSVLKADGR
jgi:hypothetical protein